MKKKLVLFDIDGTLIYHVPDSKIYGLNRFPYALKEVFNLDIAINPISGKWPYNGVIDSAILWELVKDKGIDYELFLEKIPLLSKKFGEYLEKFTQGETIYKAFAQSDPLLTQLNKEPQIFLGYITGNLGPAANWKLKHTGLARHFKFGLAAHEAMDRNKLAELVFTRAEKFFGRKFEPAEILIIGDTIHDIRCARHIGAKVIAVTTGYDKNKDDLLKENPDLLVDSLLDKRVLELLGLTKDK